MLVTPGPVPQQVSHSASVSPVCVSTAQVPDTTQLGGWRPIIRTSNCESQKHPTKTAQCELMKA